MYLIRNTKKAGFKTHTEVLSNFKYIIKSNITSAVLPNVYLMSQLCQWHKEGSSKSVSKNLNGILIPPNRTGDLFIRIAKMVT